MSERLKQFNPMKSLRGWQEAESEPRSRVRLGVEGGSMVWGTASRFKRSTNFGEDFLSRNDQTTKLDQDFSRSTDLKTFPRLSRDKFEQDTGLINLFDMISTKFRPHYHLSLATVLDFMHGGVDNASKTRPIVQTLILTCGEVSEI
jgi:hypothetical protein